jgi:hypothetical protein
MALFGISKPTGRPNQTGSRRRESSMVNVKVPDREMRIPIGKGFAVLLKEQYIGESINGLSFRPFGHCSATAASRGSAAFDSESDPRIDSRVV